MDSDIDKHKEFRFSHDGSFIAVGMSNLRNESTPKVCVIRVADGRRFDVPNASYDFGGCRLAIDSESLTLFSGAYHKTGIAAYDFESGSVVWERRDLKKLGQLAYDAFEGNLYCLRESRTVVLTGSSGKEHAYYRSLTDVFFGGHSKGAIFDTAEVQLTNRASQSVHVLPRATQNILQVAFTGAAAVISWVSGPVTAYDLATGMLLWTYQPEGAHAYSIASASDNASVWVAEHAYPEPPWHRLRLLSPAGEAKQEVRCALGHSFEIAPFHDSVIRGDLAVTPIGKVDGN